MKLKNAELIKGKEGLRLEAYLPTPQDVWTIGWGHTATARPGMVITEAQAQQLFESDIAWAEDAVNTKVKVALNQNQFDALVSFVFNVGETRFYESTMLRKLNAGDYEGAANEFPRWNRQKGKVLRGLTIRRAAEQALFLSAYDEPTQVQSVDEPPAQKPLWKSKEIILGALSSIGSTAAALTPLNQTLIIGVIVVAGLAIVANRLWARHKGQR